MKNETRAFGLKKIIALISLIGVIWIMFLTNISAYTSEELESANNLAKKWIIKNHSDNPELYNLDSPVLRQEIALVSRRVSWVKENGKCKWLFNDITATKPNDWACKNIEALVENDLISANTSFNPEKNISKSEALIMFIRSIWFIDFVIDGDSSKNWQEQVVDFAVENEVAERFTDYNTEAKRWWIFKVADYSIKVKEYRVKAGLWKDKYSDEVKIPAKNNTIIYVEAEDWKLSWAWDYSTLWKSSRGEEAYLWDGWATVSYDINSNKDDFYNLYIRLSDDGIHSNWSRSATILINWKSIAYNHISENTKGWKWFYLGNITLKQWKNSISFRKNATTSAAFIMDAFKLVPWNWDTKTEDNWTNEKDNNEQNEEDTEKWDNEPEVGTKEFLEKYPNCTENTRNALNYAREFNAKIDLSAASQYVESTSYWVEPCWGDYVECTNRVKDDYLNEWGKYTPCPIWTSCYRNFKTELIQCATNRINCIEKEYCWFVTE